MDLILEQYELHIKSFDKNFIIGEIRHWKHTMAGGNNITPVGHLIITTEKGNETFLPHQFIQLYLRSDVRYNAKTQETVVIANPERQAGPNKELLKRLIQIRDSSFPYYHEKLPDKILDYLMTKGLCKEPIGMNICHFTYDGFMKRGQLWDD